MIPIPEQQHQILFHQLQGLQRTYYGVNTQPFPHFYLGSSAMFKQAGMSHL